MTEATTATVTSPNHRIARAVNITTLTIIVVLGITFLVGDEPVFEIIVLAVWCLLSSAYMAAWMIALTRISRQEWRATPTLIATRRPGRVASLITTILASLIGVTAGDEHQLRVTVDLDESNELALDIQPSRKSDKPKAEPATAE